MYVIRILGFYWKKNSYKKVEIDNYDFEECEVVL